MFGWYGFIGIILIVLVEINFFLKIEPFATWYFPIILLGYILTLDAVIFQLKKNSLISNRHYQFIGMLAISVLIWLIFDIFNTRLQNWTYSGAYMIGIGGILKDAFVLPAFFETFELIRTIHLFDKEKIKKKYRITKRFLYIMVSLGILFFFLPLFFPEYAFPLVWLSFFFLLDPINYLNKQPSIIRHLKNGKLAIPLSLLLAGITLGLLWEFWNYWAVTKWAYSLPYFNFFKIFEMPILGYLGYLGFSFELYSMYWFVRSLFVKKEKLLVN